MWQSQQFPTSGHHSHGCTTLHLCKGERPNSLEMYNKIACMLVRMYRRPNAKLSVQISRKGLDLIRDLDAFRLGKFRWPKLGDRRGSIAEGRMSVQVAGPCS